MEQARDQITHTHAHANTRTRTFPEEHLKITNHTFLAKPKSATETLAMNGVSSYRLQYHSEGTWDNAVGMLTGEKKPPTIITVCCAQH